MLDTLCFVSKHALTDPQGDRVLAALRRRLETVHGGNVLALSRELGKSQSALWQLFNDRTRPSLAMAQALAGVMGCSVDTLLSGPRERAAELAREIGVPEQAIARVLAEPEPLGARPVLWFVDRMRAVATLGDGSGEIETPSARRVG